VTRKEFRSAKGFKRIETDLAKSVSRGFAILFLTSTWPLRTAGLMLFGIATFSLIYSFYVLFVSASTSAERGWASISIQLAISFFVFSIVVYLIIEYLVQQNRRSEKSSKYYVTEVTTSPIQVALSRLNLSGDEAGKPEKV
jgi:hypothetical protein